MCVKEQILFQILLEASTLRYIEYLKGPYAPKHVINPVLWLFDKDNPREPDADYQKEQLLVDCALLVITHDATVTTTRRIYRGGAYQGKHFDCDWVCTHLPYGLREMERKGQLEMAWEAVRPYTTRVNRVLNGPGRTTTGRMEDSGHGEPYPDDCERVGPPTKRFEIALSFPGERRAFVEQIALYLADRFGCERVLYDGYHEAEFARPELDIYLPKLYSEDSELIVIFLCADYARKRWCKLEWRFIRQLIATTEEWRIMFVSFDNIGAVPEIGILSGDGYVEIGSRTSEEIAELVLKRLEHNRTSRR